MVLLCTPLSCSILIVILRLDHLLHAVWDQKTARFSWQGTHHALWAWLLRIAKLLYCLCVDTSMYHCVTVLRPFHLPLCSRNPWGVCYCSHQMLLLLPICWYFHCQLNELTSVVPWSRAVLFLLLVFSKIKIQPRWLNRVRDRNSAVHGWGKVDVPIP